MYEEEDEEGDDGDIDGEEAGVGRDGVVPGVGSTSEEEEEDGDDDNDND